MAYNQLPNYIVLDFETSGFDKSNKMSNSHLCAITQVAMVLIDGKSFQELERYQAYILPYDSKHEYQEGAEKVTGINKQFLYDKGVVLKDAIEDISSLVKKHNDGMWKTIVVGQNIIFDIDFLVYAYRWAKVDMSKVFYCQLIDGVHKPKYIDVMDMAKLSTQTANSYNLASICGMLELDYADGHDAMNDVLMTLDAFRAFMGRLKNSSSVAEEDAVEGVRKQFEF
jgi:DNA polymerase III epsilon subunit-like protein